MLQGTLPAGRNYSVCRDKNLIYIISRNFAHLLLAYKLLHLADTTCHLIFDVVWCDNGIAMAIASILICRLMLTASPP